MMHEDSIQGRPRRSSCLAIVALLLAGLVGWSRPAVAVGSSSAYASLPPTSSESTPPLVMLLLSRDHELFRKAYSDFSDLDGDGVVDTTYTDGFRYLGYFDSQHCYRYDTGLDRFQAVGEVDAGGGHQCTTLDGWSGNFLNWATMTRVDLVRRVLYGGKRREDPVTAGLPTVLERSLLPPDVHAFAKVYGGADIASLVPAGVGASGSVTLCNVTDWAGSNATSGALDTGTHPPVVRVADGAHPNWAATEFMQCDWQEGPNSLGDADRPSQGASGSQELHVLVERCVLPTEQGGAACQQLDRATPDVSDDLWKPWGLLHRYAGGGLLRFGLMTGSYEHNARGGVLRHNVTELGATEIDPDNGTLGTSGLIASINALRIGEYQLRDIGAHNQRGQYLNCGDYVPATDVAAGSCADWGNPLGEIYLETLRYFAGLSAHSAFQPTAPEPVAGLALPAWQDPFAFGPSGALVPCARCVVVTLSTSLNTFDALNSADWDAALGLPLASSPATAVASIQTLEGLDGATVLVGDVTGSPQPTDECSEKPLTAGGLAQASGICLESPNGRGGFGVAGAAYSAFVGDLRPDASEPAMVGDQNVRNFVVALSEELPQFAVSGSPGQAQLVPLCRSRWTLGESTDWQRCSLIDVVDEGTVPPTGDACESGTGYRRFRLLWEGTSWGSDYDFDVEQTLEYCELNGEVLARVKPTRDAAAARFEFGVSLLGVVGGGTQYLFSIPEGNGDTIASGTWLQPAEVGSDTDYLRRAIVGGGNPLPRPLSLAAKYGGFTDLDGDGTPVFSGNSADRREWDNRDNLTLAPVAGGDGQPDNYFELRNPAALADSLDDIFNVVAAEVSAGAAAAVVANNASGEGVVVQALYHPKVAAGGTEVSWTGTLQGLLVDSQGRLREDGDGDATLDGCDQDPVVEIFTDPFGLDPTPKVRRYLGASADCLSAGTPAVDSLESLAPLWSTREALAQIPEADLALQRTYSAPASTGRTIYTVAANATEAADGRVDLDSGLAATRFREFNASNATEASGVIDYVRGVEQAGLRSRTIDADGDGLAEPWRLGDVVHSTPLVVAAPRAGYQFSVGDSTYAAFANQYSHRRQVLYVGGNDGMLHAINGGFWDEANKRFALQMAGEVQHTLGAELWGFVPRSLLPHLRWLTEPAYPHVAYVDGEPVAFDANVFPDDATHPGGWGTILVVGMRFGGGAIDIDTDGNPSTTDETFRSAYLVLDITDPEQPPQLIAEISHPKLGFTTVTPQLVRNRVAGVGGSWSAPSANQWTLVFGSGPTEQYGAESSQGAHLFFFDLSAHMAAGSWDTAASALTALDLSTVTSLGGAANLAFVGQIAVRDWNQDASDDWLYFGLVGGAANSQTGALVAYQMDWSAPGTPASTNIHPLLLGAGPVATRPIAVLDDLGEAWIHAGSGKLLHAEDATDSGARAYYGIQLPDTVAAPSSVATADLLATEAIQVFADGSLNDIAGVLPVSVTSFDGLLGYIRSAAVPGWKLQLPNARVVAAAARSQTTLFIPAFDVGALGTGCGLGSTTLHAVDYRTGTPSPFGVFGTDASVVQNSAPLALPSITVAGLSAAPQVFTGDGGTSRILIQEQSGALTGVDVNTGLGATSGRRAWRRLLTLD